MKIFRLIHFLLITVTLIFSLYHSAVFATTKNTNTILTNKNLEILESSFDGKIGVSAIDTTNNHQIQYHAFERFPIQSTSKMMAVASILKQSIKDNRLLQQKVTFKKQDLVFWSPITEKNINSGMTISDLCAAAMMYSDNTAINLIVKKLGGPSAVTAFARTIGDNTFQINSWEPELNSNPHNPQDTSTPKAMMESLKKLTFGNILEQPQKEKLVAWMKGNTTGDTRIRAGVPKGWIVADKTGASDSYGISNDIAIIWPPKCAPIVVAIYTVQNKKDTIRRDDIVASTTRILLNDFSRTNACISKNT